MCRISRACLKPTGPYYLVVRASGRNDGEHGRWLALRRSDPPMLLMTVDTNSTRNPRGLCMARELVWISLEALEVVMTTRVKKSETVTMTTFVILFVSMAALAAVRYFIFQR